MKPGRNVKNTSPVADDAVPPVHCSAPKGSLLNFVLRGTGPEEQEGFKHRGRVAWCFQAKPGSRDLPQPGAAGVVLEGVVVVAPHQAASRTVPEPFLHHPPVAPGPDDREDASRRYPALQAA